MSDVSPRETILVLYVFSGPHLGAQIALPDGTWSLGGDDASDLILSGLAPLHAELEIAAGDPPHVTVRPKGGPVIYQDRPAESEVTPGAGEAWYLGETLFVWNVPGASQEQIVPNMRVPGADVGTDVGGDESPPSDGGTPENTDESPTEASPSENAQENEKLPEEQAANGKQMEDYAEPVAMPTPVPPPPLWKRLVRPLPLALLAVLLCALSFPLTSTDEADPAAVQAVLKELSLPYLDVSSHPPGILVAGSVAQDEERVRIADAVQKFSFPVYLDIAIDADRERAVSSSLGCQGFFPLVRMVHREDESHLLVSCFMRDSLVERAAFSKLEEDVPPPPKVKRHIVYASDIEAALRTELNAVGFSDVDVLFLPGMVTFTGNLSEERKAVLDRIRSTVQARFGVPLFGENIARFAQAPQGARLSVEAPSVGEEKTEDGKTVIGDLGGLVITVVFVAPISFITTQDGGYFFSGSRLPNGDLLERINTKELTLRRGATRYTYQLRGSR